MKNSDPVEIYIHVPFCARKCDYCDFVSFVKDSDTKSAYFNALIKEIELKAEAVGRLPVGSVFLGGGTPSLALVSEISRVLETLKKSFLIEETAEITMEANPNSLTEEKLAGYRAAGINRLSIGLQSTVDEELKALSRLHTYGEFLKAYDSARKTGFNNINIDLMSALPGQTVSSYRTTLERVLELEPEHISAYSLIIEEGTPFFDRYPDGTGLPDEDTDREMYHMTGKMLKEKGYERYEISNYAKKGYECRHNIGYWQRTPYLGFGIAAASLFEETRYTKHSDLKRYIEGDYTEEVTPLTGKDAMEEFMFLGLRLTKGVSNAEFKENFGTDIMTEYGQVIRKLTEEGLLICDKRTRLTEKGMDIANYCMAMFLH